MPVPHTWTSTATPLPPHTPHASSLPAVQQAPAASSVAPGSQQAPRALTTPDAQHVRLASTTAEVQPGGTCSWQRSSGAAQTQAETLRLWIKCPPRVASLGAGNPPLHIPPAPPPHLAVPPRVAVRAAAGGILAAAAAQAGAGGGAKVAGVQGAALGGGRLCARAELGVHLLAIRAHALNRPGARAACMGGRGSGAAGRVQGLGPSLCFVPGPQVLTSIVEHRRTRLPQRALPLQGLDHPFPRKAAPTPCLPAGPPHLHRAPSTRPRHPRARRARRTAGCCT